MNRSLNVLALLLSGLAIGWIMGMSVSPVVQTTLSTLLTVLVGVLSLVAGTQPLLAANTDRSRRWWLTYLRDANLLPVAVFLLALAGGSAVGIFTRTNDLLGPRPSIIAKRWGANGADSLRIVRSLLTASFGTNTGGSTPLPNPSNNSIRLAALYNTITPTPDFCKRTKYKNGGELKTFIQELIREQQQGFHKPAELKALDSLQYLLDDSPTETKLQQIRNDLCKNLSGS